MDLSQGANLTKQSLLEPDIGSYTPEGFRTFVYLVEFVLNSIPPDLQPSEQTRYTSLYSRLKVRLMRGNIDRITDSRHTSHVRCWTGRVGEGGEAAETAAAAKAKPKAKPKPKPTSDSKGSSKGKGQDDTAKPDSKGKGSKGDGKAKAKPKPDAPSVPSIFWPKGTCNSRSSCPFYHHPKAAPKAAATKSAPNPTGSAPGGLSSSTAAAKATVATVVAGSASKASAVKVRQLSTFPFLKEVSQTCFAFDAVNLENRGRLTE